MVRNEVNMKEFDTEQAMAEIREKIAASEERPSDLGFTTFYYRKLIRMLEEPKDLVLFGAGRYGEMVFAALSQEGLYTVRCFCDNSAAAAGGHACGLEILSPQEAAKRYPDAGFVITPKDYDNEILRQLVNMGIKIECIFIFNLLNTGMVSE